MQFPLEIAVATLHIPTAEERADDPRLYDSVEWMLTEITPIKNYWVT